MTKDGAGGPPESKDSGTFDVPSSERPVIWVADQTLPEPDKRLRIDIASERERFRKVLATLLFVLLAVTVLMSFGLVVVSYKIGLTPGDATVFIGPILASVSTLVASVVGFYFGAATSQNDSRNG